MKTNTITRATTTALALIACLLLPQPGHAFYNPSTGRWLSRDPIEEKGGVNLYCVASNDPVGGFDADGQIKVSTLTSNPTTTCGSADGVDFDFTLDKPAAEDGYIVQENTVSIPYVSGIVNGNIWTDHYWEAWFVKKNQVSPTTQAALGHTDHVFWNGQPNSRGGGGIKGKIKFFFAKRTGDLGDPGANPPTPPSQSSGWTPRNSSPSSGSLPSTRNERSVTWWNDPPDNGEAIAERSVTTAWDCTCETQTSTIKVSP
jgi:hypothetical protein